MALTEWARDNMVHFYGTSGLQNMVDHWGHPTRAPVSQIINGTVRATESVTQHWTAGCHGTAGFYKAVLRAVNIPVQILYVCGHAQIYFPTEGLYLDHGDNPYSSNVSSSSSSIEGIFIDEATHLERFGSSPDFLSSGDANCSNVGRAASEFQ